MRLLAATGQCFRAERERDAEHLSVVMAVGFRVLL